MTRRTMRVVAEEIATQTEVVLQAKAELDAMVAERQKQVADEIDRVWEEREARDLQEQE